MIRYDLKCSVGHEFNSWFASRSTFDRLKTLGLLECVECGCVHVTKLNTFPKFSRKVEKPLAGPIMTAAQAVQALKDQSVNRR